MDTQLPLSEPEILDQLKSADPQVRLEVLRRLAQAKNYTPAVTRALERLAVSDPEQSVREASLNLLAEPEYQLSQRTLTELNPNYRKALFKEIGIWEKDGLLTPVQARVLKSRMGIEPIQWKKPVSADFSGPKADAPQEILSGMVEEAPAAELPKEVISDRSSYRSSYRSPDRPLSFSKLLLSETSIKIALFLGAFFVLSSAIILMALIEVARLPILGFTTTVFFAGALSLKRRLPLASFVLFIVAALLLPIDAAVIASLARISDDRMYWTVTTIITSSVFVLGFAWYESRLLSILGYLGYVLSLILLAAALELDFRWATALQLLLGMLGLAAAYRVYRWKNRRLFQPLFILIQIDLFTIMGWSALILIAQVSANIAGEWLALAACFGLGAVGYLQSDWITRKVSFNLPFFPYLAVACLAVFPILFYQAFKPPLSALLAFAWGCGLLLTVLGEVFNRRPQPWLKAYDIPLYLAGLTLFIFAAGVQAFENIPLATGYLAGVAAVYFALATLRMRWVFWSLGLFSAYLAYLFAFQIPVLVNLNLFLGAVHLVPALVLLSVGLVFYRRKASVQWWGPAIGLGLLAGYITVQFSLALGFGSPTAAGWVFLVIAAYIALVSAVFGLPLLAGGATLSLAIAVFYFLQPWEQSGWLLPFTGLAALFYICGRLMSLKSQINPWSIVMRISGLGLVGLVAVTQYGLVQPRAYLAHLLLSLFLAWEATGRGKTRLGYLSLSALASGLGFLLYEKAVPLNSWVWYFSGLASAYFLIGLVFSLPGAVRSGAAMLRLSGLVLMLLAIFVLPAGDAQIYASSLVFFLLAVFVAVESVLRNRPHLNYLAAGSLWIALGVFTSHSPAEFQIAYFLALGVIYFLCGWWMARWPRSKPYGNVLVWAGLALGAFASLGTLGSGHSAFVLFVAIVAGCYTIQAIRLRNVWLGYPASALFYVAYLAALHSVHATQPQFYTIGAAVLGVILHYLLMRNRQQLAALLTGLAAQLILLGNTYFQLVNTSNILFFYLVFFQSLILLVYGLLARSRSFVGIPILFSVLTVVTITFSLLKGLPTAILIGSTGLLLLFLGSIALLLREQLVHSVDRFGQHLSNW